jgi:hypothetical protein
MARRPTASLQPQLNEERVRALREGGRVPPIRRGPKPLPQGLADP